MEPFPKAMPLADLPFLVFVFLFQGKVARIPPPPTTTQKRKGILLSAEPSWEVLNGVGVDGVAEIAGVLRGNTVRGNKTRNSEREMAL